MADVVSAFPPPPGYGGPAGALAKAGRRTVRVGSAFRRTRQTTGPADAGPHARTPAKAGLYVVIGLLVSLSTLGAAENALLDAVERGDRAAALGLLAKGAKPNVPGADGTTAIMWAAANDDLELVRALIKAGADVKVKNQFGSSAMTEAAIIGSARIIDVLLKSGADPNTKNPEGETPLMAVARSGKV